MDRNFIEYPAAAAGLRLLTCRPSPGSVVGRAAAFIRGEVVQAGGMKMGGAAARACTEPFRCRIMERVQRVGWGCQLEAEAVINTCGEMLTEHRE